LTKNIDQARDGGQGPGFLESIYEEALKVELSEHELYYECQKEIKIEYLGVQVGVHRLDLLVENRIIVELKAVNDLADIHFAQLRSYLKATGLKVGLLLNFAKATLGVRRPARHRSRSGEAGGVVN